jgi:hypothetical protein
MSTLYISAVAFSEDHSEVDVVEEKRALRESCIANEAYKKVPKMSENERNTKKQEIYTSFFSGEMDVDIAVAELEELGVYALKSSIDSYKQFLTTPIASRASSNSLEYNNVTIYYDSVDDTWELGAGVWWSDDSWMNDIPNVWFPIVGSRYEIGGQDGVGISLYDLSGSFVGCTLEDTWLYVSAGGGYLSTTSHSPTGNIDSRYGVFHEFQDYAELASINASTGIGTYLYYGKHMSVFAKYSSEFENFHGRARLCYAHTWDEGYISSFGVNFEVGDDSIGAGFDIGFNNDTQGFDTCSPGETLF